MFEAVYPWLGDLNKIPSLSQEWLGLISIVASILCGVFIGVERERRDKPAGLRTVVLIAVGSTIFTIVSILLAGSKPTADPARLAAQVLPGIGFLGAGAILHQRGAVVGLTTGATIWSVAAVGVTIGAGFVAAGVVFTALIFLTLTVLHRVEHRLVGRCDFEGVRVAYRSEGGKSRHQLHAIVEERRIRRGSMKDVPRGEDERALSFEYCRSHRAHRYVLKEIADHPAVVSIELDSDRASVDGGTSPSSSP